MPGFHRSGHIYSYTRNIGWNKYTVSVATSTGDVYTVYNKHPCATEVFVTKNATLTQT